MHTNPDSSRIALDQTNRYSFVRQAGGNNEAASAPDRADSDNDRVAVASDGKEVNNMPNKDGTGPKGQGPKDGHGKGKGPGNGLCKNAGQGAMTGGKKGIKEIPKKQA